MRSFPRIALVLASALPAFAGDESPVPEPSPLATPSAVPEPAAQPSPTTRNPPPSRTARTSEKEAEGSQAPNRFEADSVIKSRYQLDGEPLEVDPD